MTTTDLQTKIYLAIKFIAQPLAIPKTIIFEAAEAATRVIVRYQQEQHFDKPDNASQQTSTLEENRSGKAG